MTTPYVLPDSHGGRGTGRPGIFGWIGQTALPALFGGGQAPPEPGLPNPIAAALMAAGGTIAQSAGGPRQFGTFGPSPLASISAGLQAGHDVYQEAQAGSRRRAAYKGVELPSEGPTQAYWSRMLSTALDQGDLPTAREISTILSSGNYYRPEGVTPLEQARIDLLNRQGYPKADRPLVLSQGQQAFDAQGRPIASVAPRPVVPRAAGGRGGASSMVNAETRAAAHTMAVADQELADLENADPAHSAAVLPRAAAAAAGVRGTPIVGPMLSGVTDAVAQSQMTPAQQQYQGAADRWTHNYVATLPKSRVSPQLIAQIRQAFFPRSGQDDPAVIASFAAKRRDATARLNAAVQGQTVDVSGLPGYESVTLPRGATSTIPRRNTILDRP